ncbi:DUF805 domain-containing protein [Brevundimonas subvibrioides]|uniref:DUF805 domain-containing protein n=1 Tax=Brevundimonas subvibrioides TaxID=74313 RepID=UPI0022B3774F|nr:DUF805 domain-containing protein [Brevundimonas subvibrioides]
MKGFLAAWSGRSSRGEYWLSIGGLVLLYLFVHAIAGPSVASLVSLPVWLFTGVRRLHDFGSTGWWATAPFGLGFVGGFMRGLGVPVPVSQEVYGLLLGGFSLLVMIVIGVWPPIAKTDPAPT